MKTVVFLYVFLFVCLFRVHASQPQPKQQNPKDCVKHPQIVKPQVTEKHKTVAEKSTSTVHSSKTGSSIPHFSVLNFINFFYSKDTLDNLRVM